MHPIFHSSAITQVHQYSHLSVFPISPFLYPSFISNFIFRSKAVMCCWSQACTDSVIETLCTQRFGDWVWFCWHYVLKVAYISTCDISKFTLWDLTSLLIHFRPCCLQSSCIVGKWKPGSIWFGWFEKLSNITPAVTGVHGVLIGD